LRLGWRERRLLKALYPAAEKKGYFTRDLVSRKIATIVLKDTTKDAINIWKIENEEKLYWRAFHRLKRRGYVAPVAIPIKLSLLLGTPQMTEIRKRANPYWTLTEKGRKAALKILREEKKEEQLREALKLLAKEGKTEATLDAVREKLWEVSKELFSSREEFQKYWTKRRLGLALRRSGIKQKLDWLKKKKVRLYILMEDGTDNTENVPSDGTFSYLSVPQITAT